MEGGRAEHTEFSKVVNDAVEKEKIRRGSVDDDSFQGGGNILKRYYRKCKIQYDRDQEYWEYWNFKYWNPGPFLNRNANNIFVAFFSIAVSVIYLAIGLTIAYEEKLRYVQDETQFRTIAKLHFDLFYIHFLNIASCVVLAAGTFFSERSIARLIAAIWLLIRFLLWVNCTRNLKHFLVRPHAYVIYNPSNPEWRWQFLSAHISYWFTVVYWVFLVMEWTYEWAVVIAFFYITALRTRITTAVIPEPMHRIQDTAFTEPCNPKKEYRLLCPTPQPWKNPNNKQLFGRPPLMISTDNRFRRVP